MEDCEFISFNSFVSPLDGIMAGRLLLQAGVFEIWGHLVMNVSWWKFSTHEFVAKHTSPARRLHFDSAFQRVESGITVLKVNVRR